MPILLLLLVMTLAGCGKTQARAIRLVIFQGAEAPLLAQKLGFFEKAGVRVEIQETPGNSKAMEALLGGSADSIVGTYDQAIQLQAKGQRVVAYRLLTECHCLALIVPPSKAKEIRKIGDLAGRTIGVGAPGGSMQIFAAYLLQKAGAAEASYAGIGVGATAFAAIDSGKVDAAVVLVSTLVRLRQRYPELRVLAETFTETGSFDALGFSRFPSMALLAKGEWLDRNPGTAQKISDAVGQAAVWIRSHTAAEVSAKLGGNLDVAALELHLPRYSTSGIFEPGAARFVQQLLEQARRIPSGSVPSIEATYSNRFLKPDLPR